MNFDLAAGGQVDLAGVFEEVIAHGTLSAGQANSTLRAPFSARSKASAESVSLLKFRCSIPPPLRSLPSQRSTSRPAAAALPERGPSEVLELKKNKIELK